MIRIGDSCPLRTGSESGAEEGARKRGIEKERERGGNESGRSLEIVKNSFHGSLVCPPLASAYTLIACFNVRLFVNVLDRRASIIKQACQ